MMGFGGLIIGTLILSANLSLANRVRTLSKDTGAVSEKSAQAAQDEVDALQVNENKVAATRDADASRDGAEALELEAAEVSFPALAGMMATGFAPGSMGVGHRTAVRAPAATNHVMTLGTGPGAAQAPGRLAYVNQQNPHSLGLDRDQQFSIDDTLSQDPTNWFKGGETDHKPRELWEFDGMNHDALSAEAPSVGEYIWQTTRLETTPKDVFGVKHGTVYSQDYELRPNHRTSNNPKTTDIEKKIAENDQKIQALEQGQLKYKLEEIQRADDAAMIEPTTIRIAGEAAVDKLANSVLATFPGGGQESMESIVTAADGPLSDLANLLGHPIIAKMDHPTIADYVEETTKQAKKNPIVLQFARQFAMLPKDMQAVQVRQLRA